MSSIWLWGVQWIYHSSLWVGEFLLVTWRWCSVTFGRNVALSWITSPSPSWSTRSSPWDLCWLLRCSPRAWWTWISCSHNSPSSSWSDRGPTWWVQLPYADVYYHPWFGRVHVPRRSTYWRTLSHEASMIQAPYWVRWVARFASHWKILERDVENLFDAWILWSRYLLAIPRNGIRSSPPPIGHWVQSGSSICSLIHPFWSSSHQNRSPTSSPTPADHESRSRRKVRVCCTPPNDSATHRSYFHIPWSWWCRFGSLHWTIWSYPTIPPSPTWWTLPEWNPQYHL